VQVTVGPDEGGEHVQPVPAADVTVWPAGTLNVSVTVPVVGPADGALATVSWYEPFPPAVKLPCGVTVIDSEGATGAAWDAVTGAVSLAVTPSAGPGFVLAAPVTVTLPPGPAGIATPTEIGG
jgi:hypothetical protein